MLRQSDDALHTDSFEADSTMAEIIIHEHKVIDGPGEERRRKDARGDRREAKEGVRAKA